MSDHGGSNQGPTDVPDQATEETQRVLLATTVVPPRACLGVPGRDYRGVQEKTVGSVHPLADAPDCAVRSRERRPRQEVMSLRRKCQVAEPIRTTDQPIDHSAPRAMADQTMLGARASAQANA